jgi:hypothetical protein
LSTVTTLAVPSQSNSIDPSARGSPELESPSRLTKRTESLSKSPKQRESPRGRKHSISFDEPQLAEHVEMEMDLDEEALAEMEREMEEGRKRRRSEVAEGEGVFV